MVYVAEGPDVADRWIADQAGAGRRGGDRGHPARRARGRGGGRGAASRTATRLTAANVGEALATRDLMADLRAADPFRQGGGRPFSAADRGRFRDALDRALRAVEHEDTRS